MRIFKFTKFTPMFTQATFNRKETKRAVRIATAFSPPHTLLVNIE
jgi:hypothetical protein